MKYQSTRHGQLCPVGDFKNTRYWGQIGGKFQAGAPRKTRSKDTKKGISQPGLFPFLSPSAITCLSGKHLLFLAFDQEVGVTVILANITCPVSGYHSHTGRFDFARHVWRKAEGQGSSSQSSGQLGREGGTTVG